MVLRLATGHFLINILLVSHLPTVFDSSLPSVQILALEAAANRRAQVCGLQYFAGLSEIGSSTYNSYAV